MDVLSNTVIKELVKAQQRLRIEQRTPVNKKAWLAKLLDWCEDKAITLGDDAPKQFWVTRAGIASVESWLAAHHQGSLRQQAQQLQSDRKGIASSNEKIASEKPMQHRVLVASTDLNLRLYQQQTHRLSELPSQAVSDLDYRQLELATYDFLVVIENRDSFNDWSLYLAQTRGLENALVIYRGHERYHSKGCEALKKCWHQAKGEAGLVYFGDADIAGLSIAINSAIAYQYLLLPNMRSLEPALDPLQSNPAYDHAQRHLVDNLPAQWASVFNLLEQHGALRQQRMFNLPLELY